MTHEEFTGATFNDLDPSETRISRSSEFSENPNDLEIRVPGGSMCFRRQ